MDTPLNSVAEDLFFLARGYRFPTKEATKKVSGYLRQLVLPRDTFDEANGKTAATDDKPSASDDTSETGLILHARVPVRARSPDQ